MTRIRTTERRLQGQALSSFAFSAYACLASGLLDHEQRPGRRDPANRGRPAIRW